MTPTIEVRLPSPSAKEFKAKCAAWTQLFGTPPEVHVCGEFDDVRGDTCYLRRPAPVLKASASRLTFDLGDEGTAIVRFGTPGLIVTLTGT